MGLPLVSVGLQFYNNEKTLHLAVQSIINQSYSNWELILHDDGSTDKSLELARRFSGSRIKLFADPVNRKRPYQLNHSLRIASGQYYAVMDGDDVAYPDRLQKQVEFLEQHPTVDLIGAAIVVFDASGKAIGKRQPPLTHDKIIARPWAGFPMIHPTFMGRMKWFRKFGYDERALGGVEDQDLLLRTFDCSRFANLPQVLLGYREQGVYLKKILGGRYSLSCGFVRQFSSKSHWIWLARSFLEQFMKAGVDCVAIGTGLNYKILKHRARPITLEETSEWQNLYATVTRDARSASS